MQRFRSLYSDKSQVIVRVTQELDRVYDDDTKKKKAHKPLLYRPVLLYRPETNKYKLNRLGAEHEPERKHADNNDTTTVAPSRQSAVGDWLQHATVDRTYIYIKSGLRHLFFQYSSPLHLYCREL